MQRKRFTIITFDPDRVGKLSWQGEGNSLAQIVWRGLCGWTYPKERGIINITLMDQLPAKPEPSEDLLEQFANPTPIVIHFGPMLHGHAEIPREAKEKLGIKGNQIAT